MLRFVFVVALLFSANSLAAPSRNLTVFAEPNMVLPLTKIARLYSQKHNVIVSVNFNSSAELINDVDVGEPADVFISANFDLIENLRQKGLVDVYNVGYIASDELVLVTNKSNKKIPAELLMPNLTIEDALQVLNNNKASLILDDEKTSSGKFSNDLIEKFSIEDVSLFHKVSEDKTPILSLIKANEEAYALLLASQIKNKEEFQVLATKKDENIFYQSLVIAGDNMEVGREFLKFLKSVYAQKILAESGFLTNK